MKIVLYKSFLALLTLSLVLPTYVHAEGCDDPASIVAVGGIGSTSDHPMFPWIEGIDEDAVGIPLNDDNAKDKNVDEIREQIEEALKNSDKVLVVAFSLGSIISFNLSDEFAGENIRFLYVDPPYDIPNPPGPLKYVIERFDSRLQAINAAKKGGIEGLSPAQRVNWTDGKSTRGPHDPWSSITDEKYQDQWDIFQGQLDRLKDQIERERCAEYTTKSVDTGTSGNNLTSSRVQEVVLLLEGYGVPADVVRTIKIRLEADMRAKESVPKRARVLPSATQSTQPTATFRRIPASDSIGTSSDTCVFTRSLYRGRRDAVEQGEVTQLQNVLKELGFFTGEVVGIFGPETEEAVQSFQRAKGLASSGSYNTNGYGGVGPKTRSFLMEDCNKLNRGERIF